MHFSPALAVLLGAMAICFAPIFVRLTTLPPTMSAFYRCFLAALMLAPALFFLSTKRDGMLAALKGFATDFDRRTLYPALFFAVDLSLWHKCIVYTGAGIATVLANVQIFFVTAYAVWKFGERPGLRFVWQSAVAVLGIFLLSVESITGNFDRTFLIGIVLGVATGASYAGYLLSFRALKPRDLQQSFHNLLAVSFLSSLFILGFAGIEGSFVLPDTENLLLMALLAFICQILGWLAISWGSHQIPATTTASLIMVQPVLAIILGTAWLGERLSFLQMIGALLTLVSVYLMSLSSGKMREEKHARQSDASA